MKIEILLPALLTMGLAAFTFLLAHDSSTNLPQKILREGRIVLSSGDFLHDMADPVVNGEASNVLDDDTESPAVLRYPMPPPEGTYLLMDLGLTHWPPLRKGDPPRTRLPRLLRIYNGLCGHCDTDRFRSYSRIRQARVELLYRRANDPDVEFVIPRAHVVYTTTIELPDSPEPFTVLLPVVRPAESPQYPLNVEYIICKVTVLSVYPGSRFPGRVAVREIRYGDLPADGTLQTKSDLHFWN